MRNPQELAYGEHADYGVGSPHLSHAHLRSRLVGLLIEVIHDLHRRRLPLTVLEVGAGHGGYTEPALAAGCSVTATEMSRPSVEALQRRFGTNEHFSVAYDDDGALEAVAGQEFSLILCSSVLHHIPDYLGFVDKACEKHLAVDGSFLSIQDPLWYPTCDRTTRVLSKAAYLAWRTTQGQYERGFRTLSRRLRNVYDDDELSDVVEYHVVRQGVNQHAVVETLRPRFEDVSLTRYWSTQARVWQRLGDAARLENTFAVAASGFRAKSVGHHLSAP